MGADTTFAMFAGMLFAGTRVAGINESFALTNVGVRYAEIPRAGSMRAGSMRDRPVPVSRNRELVETIIFRTIEYQDQVIGDKFIESRLWAEEVI